MTLKCLIIRSAGDLILRSAVLEVQKKNSQVHVLSNREIVNVEVNHLFTDLKIEVDQVSWKDNSLLNQYDRVILLIDLQRYSLINYQKFFKFISSCKASVFYYDGRQLLSSQLALYMRMLCKKVYWKRWLSDVAWLGLVRLLLMGLLSVKVVRPIVFCRVMTNRVAHLAANNDLFFRKRKLAGDRKLYLGVIHPNALISNQQLFKMVRRLLPVVKSKVLDRLIHMPQIAKSEFFLDLTLYDENGDGHLFDETPKNYFWIKREEDQGKKELAKMGVDSWFVCFHSRDSVYLNKTRTDIDFSYHDYRDCSIDNYLDAMDYVTKLGGYAIRMGYLVGEPLDNRGNSRIIDYACQYRSDFMDIYLLEYCKFFVCSTAGLVLVASALHTPIVRCNNIPQAYAGVSHREITIPKKIFSEDKKRNLTFKEIFESDICRYYHGDLYAKDNLVAIENTPEEILDATREMNDRLDKKYSYTQEDNNMQERYRNLFRLNKKYYYDYTTRIGRDFLLKNQDLLK